MPQSGRYSILLHLHKQPSIIDTDSVGDTKSDRRRGDQYNWATNDIVRFRRPNSAFDYKTENRGSYSTFELIKDFDLNYNSNKAHIERGLQIANCVIGKMVLSVFAKAFGHFKSFYAYVYNIIRIHQYTQAVV